jgi:hypothetical protein
MAEISVRLLADVAAYRRAMDDAAAHTRGVADALNLTEREAKQALTALDREAKTAKGSVERLSFAAKGLGGRFGEMFERLANLGRAGAVFGAAGLLTLGVTAAAQAGTALAGVLVDVARTGAEAADEMERLGYINVDTADAAREAGAAFADMDTSGKLLSTLFAALLGPGLSEIAEYTANVAYYMTQLIERYPLLSEIVMRQILGPFLQLAEIMNSLNASTRDADAALKGQALTLEAIGEALEALDSIPLDGYDEVPKRIEGGLRKVGGAIKDTARDLSLLSSEFLRGGEMGTSSVVDTGAWSASIDGWTEAIRVQEEYQRVTDETAQQQRDTATAVRDAWIAAIGGAADAVGSLAEAFPGAAKELYIVQKALSIAQIGANTAVAIMAALAQGGAAGPVLAGVYAALGVANAAAVAASSIGSPPVVQAPGAAPGAGAGTGGPSPSDIRLSGSGFGPRMGNGGAVSIRVGHRAYDAMVDEQMSRSGSLRRAIRASRTQEV